MTDDAARMMDDGCTNEPALVASPDDIRALLNAIERISDGWAGEYGHVDDPVAFAIYDPDHLAAYHRLRTQFPRRVEGQ